MSDFQEVKKDWMVYPVLTTTGRKSGRPRRTMLDETTPEPQKADLVWVWPLLLLGALLVYFLTRR